MIISIVLCMITPELTIFQTSSASLQACVITGSSTVPTPSLHLIGSPILGVGGLECKIIKPYTQISCQITCLTNSCHIHPKSLYIVLLPITQTSYLLQTPPTCVTGYSYIYASICLYQSPHVPAPYIQFVLPLLYYPLTTNPTPYCH